MAAGDLALALATSVISATDMESVHPEHAATKARQGRLLSCRKLTSSASSHAPVLCQSRKSATTPIGSNHTPTANAHYCHLQDSRGMRPGGRVSAVVVGARLGRKTALRLRSDVI